MISRQAVLEYLDRHPSHTTWQMRLHFLQASHRLGSQASVSIGSIANQLNYILRDLEAIGTIAPRTESLGLTQHHYSGYSTNDRFSRGEAVPTKYDDSPSAKTN
jgi:hypothetical protein